MKLIINATRYDTWCAWVGRFDWQNQNVRRMSACRSEVDSLFNGLRTAREATFEISNRRPIDDDYHTFIYHPGWNNKTGNYQVTEIASVYYKPLITSNVSRQIRSAFKRKTGKPANKIYVSIY